MSDFETVRRHMEDGIRWKRPDIKNEARLALEHITELIFAGEVWRKEAVGAKGELTRLRNILGSLRDDGRIDDEELHLLLGDVDGRTTTGKGS